MLPKSLDLTLLDFKFWEYLFVEVYRTKRSKLLIIY